MAKNCPHCGKDTTLSPIELESIEKVQALMKKAIKITPLPQRPTPKVRGKGEPK